MNTPRAAHRPLPARRKGRGQPAVRERPIACEGACVCGVRALIACAASRPAIPSSRLLPASACLAAPEKRHHHQYRLLTNVGSVRHLALCMHNRSTDQQSQSSPREPDFVERKPSTSTRNLLVLSPRPWPWPWAGVGSSTDCTIYVRTSTIVVLRALWCVISSSTVLSNRVFPHHHYPLLMHLFCRGWIPAKTIPPTSQIIIDQHRKCNGCGCNPGIIPHARIICRAPMRNLLREAMELSGSARGLRRKSLCNSRTKVGMSLRQRKVYYLCDEPTIKRLHDT